MKYPWIQVTRCGAKQAYRISFPEQPPDDQTPTRKTRFSASRDMDSDSLNPDATASSRNSDTSKEGDSCRSWTRASLMARYPPMVS